MVWLSISILCFLWIVVWTIIHAYMFKEALIYRQQVEGMPLWTLLVPMIIFAITIVLFLNTLT